MIGCCACSNNWQIPSRKLRKVSNRFSVNHLSIERLTFDWYQHLMNVKIVRRTEQLDRQGMDNLQKRKKKQNPIDDFINDNRRKWYYQIEINPLMELVERMHRDRFSHNLWLTYHLTIVYIDPWLTDKLHVISTIVMNYLFSMLQHVIDDD